jgi:hypothetical protein
VDGRVQVVDERVQVFSLTYIIVIENTLFLNVEFVVCSRSLCLMILNILCLSLAGNSFKVSITPPIY